MSNYNWCHGPNCHTYQTQSRISGSVDNKVLRTIKIKWGRYNYSGDEQPNMWDYFCNQSCLMDFINTHISSVIAIAPRREALETPVKVETKTYNAPDHPYYNGRKYKTITKVDNSNG